MVPGPAQSANAGFFAGSFYGHLPPLPTGQILYTDWLYPGFGARAEISVYTPTGTYNPAWAPKILTASTNINRGTTYVWYGTQLAGVSQGGAYGDDYQPNTNLRSGALDQPRNRPCFLLPHVQSDPLRCPEYHLHYTHFDVPARAKTGLSTLVAVTNGIPSNPIAVNVH